VEKAREYQHHAAECRALAGNSPTEEHRRQLLKIAEIWEILAIEHERLLNELEAGPVPYDFKQGAGFANFPS